MKLKHFQPTQAFGRTVLVKTEQTWQIIQTLWFFFFLDSTSRGEVICNTCLKFLSENLFKNSSEKGRRRGCVFQTKKCYRHATQPLRTPHHCFPQPRNWFLSAPREPAESTPVLPELGRHDTENTCARWYCTVYQEYRSTGRRKWEQLLPLPRYAERFD